MNTGSVNSLMNQQLKALKEIEELLAHDDKQTATHSIKREDIEALKTYVGTMKLACNTAIALAKHYESKSAPAKPAAPAQPATEVDPDDNEEENEAPPAASAKKKKEPAKKPEPVKEEPPIDEDLDFLN